MLQREKITGVGDSGCNSTASSGRGGGGGGKVTAAII
jgi:hypothetical protein